VTLTGRRLGWVALGLAALAPLAGSPFAFQRGNIDVARLARQVEREEDHVTALELAAWIKDRRPRLRILDLRPAAQFDSLHVPGAERVDLDTLAAVDLARSETIVLYSEAGAHAAQAWVFLRALGFEHVVFLRGGIYEWIDQVLSPSLAVDATPAERVAYARASALSRYFGGVPLGDVPRVEQAKSVVRLRRRGC
jgi:rhodanese-related sulfurtransferase